MTCPPLISVQKENEDYKAASDKANNDVIHTYKVKYEQLEAGTSLITLF